MFQNHGGQRFLKMIRTGDGSGVYFPKTRMESEARATGVAGAAVATP